MEPFPRSLAAIFPRAKRQLRGATLSCCMISFGVFAMTGGHLVRAANVSLSADDQFGASSFDSAGNWNPSGAPVSGKTYSNNGYDLRVNGSPTFAGDSLTITGSSIAGGRLILKGATGANVTVGNLILSGGLVINGVADASQSLSGVINLASSSTFASTNNTETTRTLDVKSVIHGGSSADLTIYGPSTVVLSGSNDFSGVTKFDSTQLGTLAINNTGALTNSTLDTGTSGSQTVTFTVAGTNTYNIGGLQGADSLAIGANTISVGANNANTTYSGGISGTSGTLTKVGSGALTLSSANSFTGPTSVNGGKLTIGAGGTINSTSGISIGAGELNYNSSTALSKAITFSGTGGTLSGTGTITPAVTVTSGNTYTPGAVGAVGTQTLTGGVTFNSGSIFQWDIATSSGAETGHDTVTTAVSGTGAIFNVVLGSGAYTDAFWDADRTWSDVFSTGTLASVFNSISGTGIVWDSGTSRGNVAGQGYFTKTSSTLSWTAVPEPTSALAGILLGVGLLRRKRSLRMS